MLIISYPQMALLPVLQNPNPRPSVERTFAWWNQYCRLSKDYELLPEMSESIIYTIMIRLMLKRLAKSHSTTS